MNRRSTLALCSLALAACGKVSTLTDGGDPHPDAAGPDAAAATPVTVIVSSMTLPATADDARVIALDLDSDGAVDDQLGQVLVALRNNPGFVAQGDLDAAIDDGDILQLAAFTPATGAGGAARFALYQGTAPTPAPCTADGACRRHLDGHGHFEVTPAAAEPALLGTAGGSADLATFTGGPGHATIAIAIAPHAPLLLPLIGARVRLDGVSRGGITTGVIGGGVTVTDVRDRLLPALTGAVSAGIAADCADPSSPPGCGCTAGGLGEKWLRLFDTSGDCHVEVAEVAASPAVQTLLTPDVTLEGQPALSFAVRIQAVAATFTP